MIKHFYCKKSLQILTIIFIVFIFSFFFNRNTIFAQDEVSPTLLTEMYSTGDELNDPVIPYNIFISNVSSTSFTVNWLTKEPTTGSVIYEKNSETPTKRTLDKRDSVNNEAKRYTHSVDIIDATLSSNDVIYFKLVSNDLEISNNGGTFSYTPVESLNSPPSPTSQDGTLEPDFEFDPALEDFLIVINIDNSSTWLTTTPSSEGVNWNSSLGGALKSDLSGYANNSTSVLYISVFGEQESTGELQTEFIDEPVKIPVESNMTVIPTATPIATLTPMQDSTPVPTVPPNEDPTPIPTPVLGNNPLPNTAIEDYFSLLPGIVFLTLGIYFFRLKNNSENLF